MGPEGCTKEFFRNFLRHLAAHHPDVSRLKQLQRDPHILGWLAGLRSHTLPFATITIAIRVTFLRRMLQDLAWSQQIPALAHLLSPADVPRRDECSPRPLLPEQINSSGGTKNVAMISSVTSCCCNDTLACASVNVWI